MMSSRPMQGPVAVHPMPFFQSPSSVHQLASFGSPLSVSRQSNLFGYQACRLPVQMAPGVTAAAAGPSEDLRPWIEAARIFQMNSDFEIRNGLRQRYGDRPVRLSDLMLVMKAESAGKRTIQAMGDKILLNQMLENLNVQQMPLLFSCQTEVNEEEVQAFVERLESCEDDSAFEFVLKPTHLSDGNGALVFSKEKWVQKEFNAAKLVEHMRKFLAQKASDTESEALKSLLPGYIVQPRYKSCIHFGLPLELRIVTLWGKARVGIWWWGRVPEGQKRTEKHAQRTTWFIRRLKTPGKIGKGDTWEAIHEHKTGDSKAFDRALELFQEAMPAMAAAAEGIATAVGAPFLRSDFFVGDEKWRLRLNEVAYGSGTSLRTKLQNTSNIVDDEPSIARILQEGLKLSQRRPPEYFLSKLGTDGDKYEALRVEELPQESRPRLPTDAVNGFEDFKNVTMPSPMTGSACMTPASGSVMIPTAVSPRKSPQTAQVSGTPRVVGGSGPGSGPRSEIASHLRVQSAGYVAPGASGGTRPMPAPAMLQVPLLRPTMLCVSSPPLAPQVRYAAAPLSSARASPAAVSVPTGPPTVKLASHLRLKSI